MFLGSMVEILFLHPVPLSVILIVVDVNELETCNVIHNTRFLIKHLFLKCCYTSAFQDCHFSICPVPPGQLIFLVLSTHSLLFRKNMNELQSICKLHTPKQNHVTKKTLLFLATCQYYLVIKLKWNQKTTFK